MKRISKIQNKIQLGKDRKNDYGNFAYMTIEDMIHTLKPLLDEEGLMMYLEDELVQIGERYYIKATVTVVDDEKEVVKASGYSREPNAKKGMDESQITGATSSYARKRAVSGLFLLDGEKDADSNEYQQKIHGKIPTDNQLEAKIKAAKLTDEELAEALKPFKVESFKDLNGNQKIELEKALINRIKRNEKQD